MKMYIYSENEFLYKKYILHLWKQHKSEMKIYAPT
jgi:hypothetical protein